MEPTDLSGSAPPVLVPLVSKPHPVDEFAMDYYRTLDKMRLDFGDLISLKFQKEREEKPREKTVLDQLLQLRCEDFREKVKSFFDDIDSFLQKM